MFTPVAIGGTLARVILWFRLLLILPLSLLSRCLVEELRLKCKLVFWLQSTVAHNFPVYLY